MKRPRVRHHRTVSQTSAVERALRGANIDLSQVRVPQFSAAGHIPTTRGQWRSVLADSGLVDHWRSLIHARSDLTDLLQAAPTRAGRQAPGALRSLITAAEIVIAQVEPVCWFAAAPESTVTVSDIARLAEHARNIAHGAIALVAGDRATDADVSVGDAIVDAITSEIRLPSTQPSSDTLTTALRVDPAVLNQLGGLDASARLRAASALNQEELDQLSLHVLQHLITNDTAYAPNATSVLAPMLALERPLIAHVVALHLSQDLLQMAPDHVGEVLTAWRAFLPENWAAHRSIRTHERRITAAGDSDPEDSALAEAESTATFMEGPIRRLGWTCLRLYTQADGPMPMLDELRGRLLAAGSFVMTAAGNAIVAPWRNAVNHRDMAWNPVTGELRLGEELVTPDRLRGLRQFGQAVAYGFECGVTIARASSEALAEKLELGADVRTDPQLVHTRLASLLAGHGVVCDRIEIAEDRVIFTVASLNAAAAALVLAEFAEAIDLYELSDVELKVEGRTPLYVPVAVLAELRRLRQEAGGGGLPAYALWPVIAAGRSEIVDDTAAIFREMAQRAAEAAVWVVAGLLELDIGVSVERLDRGEAVARLDQIEEALLSAWAILPGVTTPELSGLPGHISQLRDAIETNRDVRPADRRIRTLMSREAPPDLPWFTPFDE